MISTKMKGALAVFLLAFAVNSYSQNDDEASVFIIAKEHFRSGYEMFNRMNYLAAAEYFRKALTVYPEYYTAREYLARSYRLAGYSLEAATEWGKLNDIESIPSVKNKIDVLNYLEVANFNNSHLSDEFTYIDTIKSATSIGNRFPYPADIAVDDEKNIYITSFSSGKIAKFDPNSASVDSFNGERGGKLYGIDYSKGRFAYTDFSMDHLILADKKMKTIKIIGSSGSGDGEFHGPEGCVFDEQGNIYVVDSGNNRVHKYSSDGKFIMAFGKNGSYEGELDSPTDVAVYNGNVYVTDTENKRLAVFDFQGNWIKNITNDAFVIPKGITSKKDTLVIADNHTGLIFYNPETGDCSEIKEFNDDESFLRVNAAAFDREGVLYALDHARQSVDKLVPLAKHYSNLDVEISSIDASKFPAIAVYLSVRNRDGSPVYSLHKDNFKITEDKAKIHSFYVDYFKELKPKIKTVFCIDRSSQAGSYKEELLWLSDMFFRQMRKDDRVKIVDVNQSSVISNDFDWSRLRALKAIREGEYNGDSAKTGKALYNALDDLIADQSRRAVVFVTTGSVSPDSFAEYSSNTIINYARSHFVPIYIIHFNRLDPVLQKIADSTGGMSIKASQADRLKNLYDMIKGQEEYRYAIVYSTYKNRQKFSGWWSDLSVEIEINGQTGLEWGGYFVPSVKK